MMQRVLIFIVLYQLCFATTYYIDIFGIPSSTSCTQENPCVSLQDALNVAQQEGDVIYFEPGGFGGSANVGLTVTVNNLSFVGNTASNQSISCGTTTEIVGLHLASSVTNFTMKGIGLDLCRTGIQVSSAVNLAIVDCFVSDGSNLLTATRGGKIYISNLGTFSSQQPPVANYTIDVQNASNLTVENSSLTITNTLMNVINTPLTLINLAVSDSPVPIRTNGSTTIIMQNCKFIQNITPAYPGTSLGGIVNVPAKSSLYAANCVFNNNGISLPKAGLVSAAFGGVIYIGPGAYVTLVNCTLDGNFVNAGGTAGSYINGYGGAIAAEEQATVNLLTTTISNNIVQCSKANCGEVKTGGGAISCSGSSVFTLQSCNINGNTVTGAPGGAAFYCDSPCSFTINTSTIQSGDGYCVGKCTGLSDCTK